MKIFNILKSIFAKPKKDSLILSDGKIVESINEEQVEKAYVEAIRRFRNTEGLIDVRVNYHPYWKYCLTFYTTSEFKPLGDSVIEGVPVYYEFFSNHYFVERRKIDEMVKGIRNGEGLDKSIFPEEEKEEAAKYLWDNEIFSFGMEYGVLLAKKYLK